MTDITPEQRANLTKLAAYLRMLPEDYPDFSMNVFTNDGKGFGSSIAHTPVCGTAACAAGHGPMAGIEPLANENWLEYSKRAFCTGDAWAWAFEEDWAHTDNTVHGAAARIEWMLEHGVPDDHYDQLWRDAPLCYTPGAPQ